MIAFGGKLDEAIRERRRSLLGRAKSGAPVVTYMTHYIPLEILEASGVEYLSWEWLVHLYGVPDEYVEAQVPDQYFPKDFCVYSRFNFSLQLKEPNPRIAKFYIVYTCDAVAKMSEYFEKVYPIHPINLPRWKNEGSKKLWYNEIQLIKQSLQKLTGNEVGAGKLRNAISTEMRIRKKLANLCMMRVEPDFPLKSLDLYNLLQLRYLLNQESYEELIDQAMVYVSENSLENPAKDGTPVALLLGSPFIDVPPGVLGDVFCGAHIVDFVESFGVKTIEEPWREIMSEDMPDPSEHDGDLLEILADHYYKWPMSAYVLPNNDRTTSNLKLASLFGAKCALEFNYRGCEVFLAESKDTEDALRKSGMAYQHIQIGGEKSGIEQLRTRIESFLYNVASQ